MISCLGLRHLARAVRHFSQRPGIVSDKTEFVQEFDYTVTPTTYVYTSIENEDLFQRFPLVNAAVLAKRNQRSRKIRTLSREFIEDSMYNPHYGYFSKSAEIFSLPSKINMNQVSNMDTFLDRWSIEYKKQQKQASREKSIAGPSETSISSSVPDHERKNMRTTRVSKQLWHTPSELFSPHYGRTLAKYIVAKHLERSQEGQEELVIYETGAGNGTLMVDILNFIRENHPELYRLTSYNVIEISQQLASKQREKAKEHVDRISIHNCSIFDWKVLESRQCFFIALEVWDNLSHDVVRYDNTTNQPHQGYVVVDTKGDFTEVFSPKLDKLLAEYLQVREKVSYKPKFQLGWHPLILPKEVRSVVNMVMPLRSNLSQPEYIPTKQFLLFKKLKQFFPEHSLLAADFTHFTERIAGYNSPVVQTFMENIPVTVSTYMVLQGYFDIMFPTDFELAKKIYEQIIGRPAESLSHKEFLTRWNGNVEETATKTGENPMLSLYSNAAFLCSL